VIFTSYNHDKEGDKMKLRIGYAALSVALITMVSACGGTATSGSNDLLKTVAQNHQLIIGTSNDPPWSYVTKSGQANGVIPDMLRKFLKDQGVDATIKSIAMPFQSLIPSITSGRIQLIGDAMYATPERAKQVTFTRVIFYNPEALVVRKANPDHVSKLADLCGKTGGTYQGTVWVNTLQQASAKCPNGKKIEVKQYATIYDVMSDTSAGRLTAGLIDSSIAAYAVSKNPNLGIELSPGYRPPDKAADDNALAVSKSNASFVKTFDAWYAKAAAEGYTKRLFAQWGLTPTAYWLTLKG
jgi:polar amino acid transport system substrate-binding protein